VRAAGVQRDLPAKNVLRPIVGIVVGHAAGTAGRVMEFPAELGELLPIIGTRRTRRRIACSNRKYRAAAPRMTAQSWRPYSAAFLTSLISANLMPGARSAV
jgi:hypothetical protein